ncbi:hypothetical protein ACFVQB_06840 [Paenibacillus sp. NPDC057886]|uniref:hypothetical protein n=1 Tax=Paenibacillus sp. NPDC057886 TaxID=3346270 RepID=UPI0036A4A5C6
MKSIVKKQAAYETFEFEPVQAKFIGYVGQGNASNTWNSIIEFLGARELKMT